MEISAGQSLLQYRLVEKLGEGGMGVVWKAVDTTLGREVAIKLLPAEFASDAERLARFEREARVLASLNHPHIATIHGLHEQQGRRFLAMEYVPGSDLAKRLEHGSLPPREALRLALQLAEALEAAHEQGVIHRDLKPANVVLTADGKAKVLDFGLAKALLPEPAPGADPGLSPTVTSASTQAGVILGTAAYMSPEQVRGQPLDRRSDIWAFGCVLYESLTGRRLFADRTVGDTLARVLREEPDWSALPTETPAAARRLLQRCLRKDPRERLRDIGDARIELSELLAGGDALTAGETAVPASRPPVWRIGGWIGMAALLGVALIAFAVGWWSRPQAPLVPDRRALLAELRLPSEHPLAFGDEVTLAVAPDGSRVVVALEVSGDRRQLFYRELRDERVVPIAGTDGQPYGAFFSPDGRWLAFFETFSGRLKKVPVDGGAAVDLCPVPLSSRGGVWTPDGRIVFGYGYSSGLRVVSDQGGEATELTRLNGDEKSHRHPALLPDGKTVVFSIATAHIDTHDEARIATLSLDTGETKVLLDGGMYPRFLAPDRLVYARQDGIYTVRLDLARLELAGAPERVVDGVLNAPSQGWAMYDVARDGTLIYVSGGSEFERLRVVSVDRQGHATPLDLPPRNYYQIRVSPDGRRIVAGIDAANADIWTYDLRRGTLTRLTRGWDNEMPVWAPDGETIVFTSNRAGNGDLYLRSADAGGDDELLYASEGGKITGGFSPDGKLLTFVSLDPAAGFDIWLLPVAAPGEARPLIATEATEFQPAISPDGRWLAYVADYSGRPEVYVTSFPEPDARVQISNAGGTHPIWSRDGRQLFYIETDRMMEVAIETAQRLDADVPRLLFEWPGLDRFTDLPRMDLAPGGDGFLLLERSVDSSPDTIHLYLGLGARLESSGSAAALLTNRLRGAEGLARVAPAPGSLRE